MILHLGVIDQPEPNGATTYEVGTILEDKYGLFSRFAEANIDAIKSNIEDALIGALETMMQGGVVHNEFSAATDQIDKDFRTFLDNEDMAKLGVPGVPTKAALRGKSVRHKKNRGPRRPSFIDSGILQSSFRSWID